MMNDPEKHLGDHETARILARLLTSLPAATFEMETLARLAAIKATRKVPTAAMECLHRPRLLINPDFVAQYCNRDEHLFLLVMHELWHVLLAHTSQYSRVTQLQNIAFDAIINAGLMRHFKKPAYEGFFDEINPPDKFPHLLLRPPVGWPHDPQYPDDIGPVGTKRILRQLYPPPSVFAPRMPFYQEILDLIKQDLRERGMLVDGVPVLLGDHDSDGQGRAANSMLQDMMGQLVKQWPHMPPGFGTGGRGGRVNEWQTELWSTSYETRRVFADVLRKSLGRIPGPYRKRQRVHIPGVSGTSVLPNGRDRLFHAREHLGFKGVIWSQPGEVKARIRERQKRAHVYVDVSGSMSKVIPYLLNLLLPYIARQNAELFQFSTVVDHLTLSRLRNGIVKTTGGTNIRCVMDHVLGMAQSVRRVLILTDGYTGKPTPEQVTLLKEQGIQVYVILPAETQNRKDLEGIATSVTVLPPLKS